MQRRFTWLAALPLVLAVAASGQSSPSKSAPAKHAKIAPVSDKTDLDSGSVTGGVYRNQTLGLICKIPTGWVLRTDEMNVHEQSPEATLEGNPAPATSKGAKVLLAAFSRPPEARGEDVNSSILIAAESQSAYPGLKEPAQYFGPLKEVAKKEGFSVDEGPYAITVGAKPLARMDFHKNVGSRVMRQSTLVMLEHGYAVSITLIGGTEEDVEDLIDGLEFEIAAPRSDK
jgi:hypothetical protein